MKKRQSTTSLWYHLADPPGTAVIWELFGDICLTSADIASKIEVTKYQTPCSAWVGFHEINCECSTCRRLCLLYRTVTLGGGFKLFIVNHIGLFNGTCIRIVLTFEVFLSVSSSFPKKQCFDIFYQMYFEWTATHKHCRNKERWCW